jgi:hypothetical protein
LKGRYPSLRIDTLQRVADVICALTLKQTTNQNTVFETGSTVAAGVV